MRNTILSSSILIMGLLGTSLAQAENGGLNADRNNMIIVKAGSYSLDDKQQRIAGISSTFEEDSTSEFAIEYLRKFGDNFAFGGEFVSFSNKYNSIIDGDVDTLIVTANIKKYFAVADHFEPFIGAGLGAVAVDVSGRFDGSAGGLAASFSFGAEIPFEHVGIYFEFKKLIASADNETELGDTAEFDVSGEGIFAGIAVHF